MHIIDAHQHFWRIERGDYGWMDDSVAAIRRDYLPADLSAHAQAGGVVGTVVVQAADSEAETEFLLSLAGQSALIQGVVGWVDLSLDSAPESLSRFAANRYFKGVRPMLQDIEDTLWILQPTVLRNLDTLTELGLTLDALVTPRHLAVIQKLAQLKPELPIVIDHCAKPVIANGQAASEEWQLAMQRLAEFPQLYCKVSGLANEYGAAWSAEALQTVFQHVLSCFGADRLMWGSDWPVLELVGQYPDWLAAAKDLAGALSEVEQQAIFATSAQKFYSLDSTHS